MTGKKQALPSTKFVVELDDQGATLAQAYLVGEHYELSREMPERGRVSRVLGRYIQRNTEEVEKLRREVDALLSMVVSELAKKRGRPQKGGEDGGQSD